MRPDRRRLAAPQGAAKLVGRLLIVAVPEIALANLEMRGGAVGVAVENRKIRRNLKQRGVPRTANDAGQLEGGDAEPLVPRE